MATATVLAPSAHYPSYTLSYSQHSSASSVNSSTMISSEPRRHSDDNDSASRQSLPSISEVISGARPPQYPPHSQPTMAPGSGLPSSFHQSVHQSVHQYADSDKHPSPQPMHPTSSFAQRQDTLPPAFVDSPRLPFNGRHSLPPVTDRRPTPPTKPEIPPQHSHKPSDNGAYPHPPPTSHPYQPGHLPPGQVPLPSYPISPRHAVPVYDPRAQPPHPDEADHANRARFDPSINRHFEPWNYQESLSRVCDMATARYLQSRVADQGCRRSDPRLASSSISPRPTRGLRGNSTGRNPFPSASQPNARSARCLQTSR